MCLDTALLGCGAEMLSYLFGATADLQHVVNIFPGLVVVAYEPEEEAGVVQGSVAGRLADFLQAALQLLNCFSVYIQKRKRPSETKRFSSAPAMTAPRECVRVGSAYCLEGTPPHPTFIGVLRRPTEPESLTEVHALS